MIKYLIILFVAATSFFYSCRSTKKIQTAITPKDTTTTVVILPSVNPREDSVNFIKENYRRIISNHINFTTFSAKIDVDYEDAEGKK